MNSGKLVERSGNIFLCYLLGLITTDYKIIKSQNLLLLWGAVVKMVGGRGEEFGVSFECSKKGAIKIWKVQRAGDGRSKFWAFCDDAITECPHLFYFILLKSSVLVRSLLIKLEADYRITVNVLTLGSWDVTALKRSVFK